MGYFMVKMTLIFIFIFNFFNFISSGEFNDQLTLAEFGVAPNKNISLKSSSRYPSDPAGQLLRTNDYQTLQLKFGEYATARKPCRIGFFTVSESAQSSNGVPFGTRVELSGYTLDGNMKQNIEPNRFLKLVQNPNYILFNFTESFNSSNITTDLEQSSTFLSCHVTYQETGGLSGIMRSLHVQGSAYHDIEYQDLTPRLTFGSGVITALEIDDKKVTLPTSGSKHTLKAGTKFKFTVKNPASDPSNTQVWLLYVQSPTVTTKISFEMSYSLTGNNNIKNLVLTSKSGKFEGFMRVAVIQPSLPPVQPNALRKKVPPLWQLAIQMQSLPATPLSMFLLWPYQWTKNVGPELTLNQENNVYLSSCPTNSLLIPLLARSNFAAATCWYNQLVDKQNRGEVVFDIGTNAFVTLINMLIAKVYDSDILSYQNTLANPISSPNLSFSGDTSSMEQMFDTYRSEIPTSMELEFNDDSSYNFKIPAIDLVSTKPEGGEKIPLFSLPGFKALTSGHAVMGNAVNRDPIKGDVLYAHGNSTDSPGDRIITFSVNNLPQWAPRFLPDNFWNKIDGFSKENIKIQLDAFFKKPLPGLINGVYDQGKALFQIAMSAKYATYVLLAQQGLLPPYPSNLNVSSSIKNKINPLLTYIKDILDAWLITKVYESTILSNYFVGDEGAKGVVAIKGTTSATGGLTDSGNAVYTGHNRQYGYFLGSAAIVIELDKLFKNTAWISQDKTNGIATAKTKQFVDMLWRDYANPDIDDTDGMPFNRYGNPWEGLSCSKGVPPTGTYQSRNNESISEDFNGYYASWLYARAINNSNNSVLHPSQKAGFELLEKFSKSNMDMVAKAGAALFYNNGNWVYKNEPFNFNTTTGIEWDSMVDSGTDSTLGYPPCRLTKEGCLYSEYKFDLFCDDLTNLFNKDPKCKKSECDCK